MKKVSKSRCPTPKAYQDDFGNGCPTLLDCLANAENSDLGGEEETRSASDTLSLVPSLKRSLLKQTQLSFRESTVALNTGPLLRMERRISIRRV